MKASELVEQPLHEKLIQQVIVTKDPYQAAMRTVYYSETDPVRMANQMVGAGPVPEPSTLLTLAVGAAVVWKRLRKRV